MRSSDEALRGFSLSPSPEVDEDAGSEIYPSSDAFYQSYPEMVYDRELEKFIPNSAIEWEQGLKISPNEGLQTTVRAAAYEIGRRISPLPLLDHFESPYYDLSLGHDSPSPECPFGRLRRPVSGGRRLIRTPIYLHDPAKCSDYDPRDGFCSEAPVYTGVTHPESHVDSEAPYPQHRVYPWGRHRCPYLNNLMAKQERALTSVEIHELLRVRHRMTRRLLTIDPQVYSVSMSQVISGKTRHSGELAAIDQQEESGLGPRIRMGKLIDSAEALGGYALYDELEQDDIVHGGRGDTTSDNWDSGDSWHVYIKEREKKRMIKEGKKPERDPSSQPVIDARVKNPGFSLYDELEQDDIVHGGRGDATSGNWDSGDSWHAYIKEREKKRMIKEGKRPERDPSSQSVVDARVKNPDFKGFKSKNRELFKVVRRTVTKAIKGKSQQILKIVKGSLFHKR